MTSSEGATRTLNPSVNSRMLCQLSYLGSDPEASALPARLLAKIEAEADGCWLWTGALTSGYGKVNWNGRMWRVHRLVYTLLVGPIPDGYQTDHLCHTRDETCRAGLRCIHRRCCNPSHLEPVTSAENTRRGRPNGEGSRAYQIAKTHCPRGHAYDEANTYWSKQGHRFCRLCARDWMRARRAAARQAAA